MTDKESFEKRVGTTLCGKWTLERLIGAGGMAAVYVGNHKIGRREAIKILHPEVARSRDLRARFEQEAKAVNRFKHPGAVEIRDIDVSEDGAPFLVMELLEGESLSERARRLNGLSESELLRFVDELLDVLAAAHAEGIIHRDIKLDNLFLQKDGRLKVLDFGIARVRDGAMKTRTGATLGTVAYMPPEQVKGLDIDVRADLFAVGATMFRALAKRRIHEALSESDLLVKMATLPAPPFASICPSASSSTALIVDRALAFERDRRYPSALTMQADVRAVRRGGSPPFASERLAAGDRPNTITGTMPSGPAPDSIAPPKMDAPTQAAPKSGPPPPPPRPPSTRPRSFREAPTQAAPSVINPAVVPPVPPRAPIGSQPGALPDLRPPPVPSDIAPPSVAWPDMGPVPSPRLETLPLGTPAASAGSASNPAAPAPSSGAPAAPSPPLRSSPALPPMAPPTINASPVVSPMPSNPSLQAIPSPPSSLSSLPVVINPSSAHMPPSSRRREGLLLVVIGAVVVLLGVGIGLIWSLKSRTSETSPPAPSASAPTDSPSAPKLHFPLIVKSAPSAGAPAPPTTPPPPQQAPEPPKAPPAPPPQGGPPGKGKHGKNRD
jgi:serine/threonine-protein kinase